MLVLLLQIKAIFKKTIQLKMKFTSIFRLLFFCAIVFLLSDIVSAQSTFTRLGDANTTSFDDGWLFKRYGLQAGGSQLDEPKMQKQFHSMIKTGSNFLCRTIGLSPGLSVWI